MSMSEKLEQDIDPEQFHHVVMSVKNISLVRPQHISHYPYSDIGCEFIFSFNYVLYWVCQYSVFGYLILFVTVVQQLDQWT